MSLPPGGVACCRLSWHFCFCIYLSPDLVDFSVNSTSLSPKDHHNNVTAEATSTLSNKDFGTSYILVVRPFFPPKLLQYTNYHLFSFPSLDTEHFPSAPRLPRRHRTNHPMARHSTCRNADYDHIREAGFEWYWKDDEFQSTDLHGGRVIGW